MKLPVRKSLIGFAVVVGIIFLISMLYSRLRDATQDTELADITTRVVVERLKGAVNMAKARGEPVHTCHDLACEQFYKSFRLPANMTVEVDAQPDGIRISARHELGSIEAVWDNRVGGEVEELPLQSEE